MKRSAAAYVEDIPEHARKAVRFLSELSDPAALASDEKTLFAIVRALEVVGEAAKRVPEDVRRRFPDVPWRRMAAMRDRLVHDDFGVDPEIVRRTVEEDLPPLLVRLEEILVRIDREESNR